MLNMGRAKEKMAPERDPNTVKAFGEMVIVKRDFTESISKGGIIIPDSSRKPAKRGVVISAGPKAIEHFKNMMGEVKAGDMVYVHGHSVVQHRFQWEGFYYDMVLAEDIIGTCMEGANV